MINFKKHFWIIELLVLSIFSGIYSCVSGIGTANFSSVVYHDYTTSFFLQTNDTSHIDPFFAFFAILPICGFMALNGSYIYNKWSLNGIYILTRQRKRIKSFLKDTIFLFFRAIIGGLIYLIVPAIYFAVVVRKNFYDQLEISLSVFISAVAICYSLSAIENYISILIGSSYGILGGIVIFLIFGSIGMGLIGKRTTICKAAAIFDPFLSLYLSATDRISIMSVFVLTLTHTFLITIVGIVLIRKVDIGLSNKEIM